jgi:hypothetical protein
MVGGLSGMAWYMLIAIKLLRLEADRGIARSKEK